MIVIYPPFGKSAPMVDENDQRNGTTAQMTANFVAYCVETGANWICIQDGTRLEVDQSWIDAGVRCTAVKLKAKLGEARVGETVRVLEIPDRYLEDIGQVKYRFNGQDSFCDAKVFQDSVDKWLS